MNTTFAAPDAPLDGAEPALERSLGGFSLVALGIGAIIGAGIYVRTGTAAAQYAGPAVVLSFGIAAVGALLVGLCYAELATMFPIAGGAYSYARQSFGPLVGWLAGWLLTLEYVFGAAAASVGWSGYFVDILKQAGVHIPSALTSAPLTASAWRVTFAGTGINLPAVVLILVITAALSRGIRESSLVNVGLVVAKVAIALVIIVVACFYIRPANWRPFVPANAGSFGRYGWSGVLRAAGVVAFAFIGFDALANLAQEARTPRRDMPVAILGSLGVSTVLYVLIALAFTGLRPYQELNAPYPAAAAFGGNPSVAWLGTLASIATVIGLASVVLVMLLCQGRVLLAMAGDGLLPRPMARVSATARAPVVATVTAGVVAAVTAGLLPIELLGDTVTGAALLVFGIVCLCVPTLRYTRPNLQRAFRAPLVPVVPILGLVATGAIMANLPGDTWLRLAVWVGVGLGVYVVYSARSGRGRHPSGIH